MHENISTNVRGPYGLLRQYQPDLRIFFERWFSQQQLGYGFTRYGGKLSSRSHETGLDKLSKLWRQDRIDSILAENDLLVEALEALDNRHTRIEQKAWQYYGQILHLMHKESLLPDHEDPMQAIERSVRELKRSMRDEHVVNRLWLDIAAMRQADPSLFSNSNLQQHEHLDIRCNHLDLPGQEATGHKVHIEGDMVRVPIVLGETVAEGLPGKPLETVVDHPLITGKGYIIWSATQWAENLRLHTSMFDDEHLTLVEFIHE